jgi:sialate O-acetylesterase
MRKFLVGIILFTVAFHAFADIGLPSLVGDNMVLQQNARVKIWGWSGAAEKITVIPSWSNNPDTTTADRNGKWALYIQTPKAGGPFIIAIIGSWGQRVVLQNILIGEVWICSGQSNMDASYNYIGIKEVGKDAIDGNNPNIRFCKIWKTTAEYPQDNCMAKWDFCDSNTIKEMSAVAYYFVRKLNKDLKVPIGIIQSAWGGTGIETWMPEDVVKNDPLFMKSVGMRELLPWWPILPGSTYNAMIAPVTNFTIAGAIWYQGETNASYPSAYRRQLSTMISEWRKDWGIEFPFYYVQIAPWNKYEKDSAAFLRESQVQCLSINKVGMVVVSDLVDDVTDIHPQNKHDVGYRLANLALAKTYGMVNIAWRCPIYQKMEVEKNKVVVYFDADLMATGKKVNELFIAGEDKVFFPADAAIEGNKLIVQAKKVKAPVSVRYSFSNEGIGDLFSTEKLPVSPFRTDNWTKWQMGKY